MSAAVRPKCRVRPRTAAGLPPNLVHFKQIVLEEPIKQLGVYSVPVKLHGGVEVVSGLEPGERFVARGGFSLKAELGKESFGDGHGH